MLGLCVIKGHQWVCRIDKRFNPLFQKLQAKNHKQIVIEYNFDRYKLFVEFIFSFSPVWFFRNSEKLARRSWQMPSSRRTAPAWTLAVTKGRSNCCWSAWDHYRTGSAAVVAQFFGNKTHKTGHIYSVRFPSNNERHTRLVHQPFRVPKTINGELISKVQRLLSAFFPAQNSTCCLILSISRMFSA